MGHVAPFLFMEQKMKRQKLTQAEKEEKDFKQLSNVLLRMVGQAYENPRQLRRLKSWHQSLGMFIDDIEKKDEK